MRGEECTAGSCSFCEGSSASVTLRYIHPTSFERSRIPDGFHKQMRRLLRVHWFNEARMADSCNKYLIMLMKIILKTSTTHSAVPRTAAELITQHHSQGASVLQSLSRCLPQRSLRSYKCVHVCALPPSNEDRFIFANAHQITYMSATGRFLVSSTFPVQLFSEVTHGLTLGCLYLLISFSLCSQMPILASVSGLHL